MDNIEETGYLSALLDLRASVDSIISEKVFVLTYKKWEVGYKVDRGKDIDVRKVYMKLNSDKYDIMDIPDQEKDSILKPIYDTFIHPLGGATELVSLDSKTLLIKQAVPKSVEGGIILH